MQNSPEHNPIQNRRIPVLGFCRGMQMLAVISGAEIIQDLPAYFAEHGWKYNDELCIQTIQAIERTDKTFAVGLQFHPEAALVKHLVGAANRDDYMSYETALSLFKWIVQERYLDLEEVA
jgi:gamma-glutamyl-gamma-aminobutyrate hydrolase PuuD